VRLTLKLKSGWAAEMYGSRAYDSPKSPDRLAI